MSVVAQYPLGAEVFVTTDVYINDVLADPSNLTYQILGPDEELLVYVWETDAEVVRLGEGQFELAVYGDQVGRWYYRAFSIGPTGRGAMEGEFLIKESHFD